MLTPNVTASLPPNWEGEYSAERATSWIAARDRESVNLIALSRESNLPVGLVFLFETEARTGEGVDVRLGYLIAEYAWGQGFASDLIGGFVTWCRGGRRVVSLEAGVGLANVASQRVLEKSGFHRVSSTKAPGEQLLFRHTLDK